MVKMSVAYSEDGMKEYLSSSITIIGIVLLMGIGTYIIQKYRTKTAFDRSMA
jgi:hypothetical protein